MVRWLVQGLGLGTLWVGCSGVSGNRIVLNQQYIASCTRTGGMREAFLSPRFLWSEMCPLQEVKKQKAKDVPLTQYRQQNRQYRLGCHLGSCKGFSTDIYRQAINMVISWNVFSISVHFKSRQTWLIVICRLLSFLLKQTVSLVLILAWPQCPGRAQYVSCVLIKYSLHSKVIDFFNILESGTLYETDSLQWVHQIKISLKNFPLLWSKFWHNFIVIGI